MNPGAKSHHHVAAAGCAVAGVVVFQFFGNSTRGYIDTASLFYWWGYQWTNPASDTEHGWLVLGLSAWLLWRNLRISDPGFRISDPGTSPVNPETGSDPGETRAGRIPDRSVASDPDRLFGIRYPVSGIPESAIRNPHSEISAPLAAMLGGLALHAVGFAAQQARISILALLVFTWGVLRLAGGPRWGRAALFPLGFMVFAIPVNMLDSVGFWLRMWVVDASSAIARAAGIGVLQSGTQLLAPDGRYNYDVAAACSGIRSLTAMVALSLLAGYLNFQSWWRRAVVLLLCLPLVYLGNLARILAIIFAAHWGGQTWGDRAHEVMGFGVFGIVLGGVLTGIALLRRIFPEPEKCHLLNDTFAPPLAGRSRKCHLLNDTWIGVAAMVVVALAVGEMAFLHHLRTLPPRGLVGVELAADGVNPIELPAFLGTEWIGRRAEVTDVEREILPQDTGFSRKNYVAVANPRHWVFLSVVLSGRDRTSIHRPELCLVGQGWSIAGATAHTYRFPGNTRADFAVTLLRIRREAVTPRGKVIVPQLAAYWFVGGDAVVATHWQRMARDAWNRVFRARADRWAYVLIQTDASDGEAAALARMQAVLDETLPKFQRPLPSRGR